MEYLIIIILIGVVAFFTLFKRNTADSKDSDVDTDTDAEKIEATFICDECGENECICRREEKS